MWSDIDDGGGVNEWIIWEAGVYYTSITCYDDVIEWTKVT